MLLLIEQCLNGVQFGLLLFLLAAGLTLVFGIMDLVNLAHGSLYMLGAYFAATFAALTGSFVAAAVLALLASLVAGMALEVIAIRKLYGRDHLDHVLGTFGLILFFNELVRLVWGPGGRNLPLPAWLSTSVEIFPGVYYPTYRFAIIAVALVVALLLYIVVMRTKIGMLIRAGASNREMIGALGINIKLLYTFVFGVGAALAGLAGVMQAPIAAASIGMGENILIVAFVVIIIGGIGSIRGAFIASIFVGLIDTIGRAFLPDLLKLLLSPTAASTAGPALSSMLIYLLMAVVLVVRPEGLFPGDDTMMALTPRNIVAALTMVVLALVPLYAVWVGNNFVLILVTRIVILAIAAVSLNLIMGYGGMVSFGHAAYLGIGGYVVGILAYEGVPSGIVQWPLAIILCGFVSLIIGLLSLRTRGVYFIMITLAFSQMIYYVGSSLSRYGADDGLTIYRRSEFAGLVNLANKVVFYYLCLALLALTIILAWRIVNSRFGMAIRGARSNERRMRAIGFPTFRYRLTCFVIAGMICGLAGALLANHTEFISPAAMHWTRSGDLIIMVVLGGMGSLFGPVIGTLAFLALEEALSRLTEYWQIILGPLLLAIVLYARGGINGLLAGQGHE